MTTLISTKAPLNFRGQKKNWRHEFTQFLSKMEEVANSKNKSVCVVDVFGGSGILSHWSKRLHPSFTVIYNDFDNYSDRLDHVHDVNLLIDELQKLFPLYRETHGRSKMSPSEVSKLHQFLIDYKGRIDNCCLSSWIQFSGSEVRTLEELLDCDKHYFQIPKNHYNEEEVKHYLDDIVVIHEDASNYHKFKKNISSLIPTDLLVLWLLDPPYLYTDKTGYNNSYFKIDSSIDLINYFINEEYFIFFNSTKSAFTDFLHKLKEFIPSIKDDYERIDKIQKTNNHATNSEYALIRIT